MRTKTNPFNDFQIFKNCVIAIKEVTKEKVHGNLAKEIAPNTMNNNLIASSKGVKANHVLEIYKFLMKEGYVSMVHNGEYQWTAPVGTAIDEALFAKAQGYYDEYTRYQMEKLAKRQQRKELEEMTDDVNERFEAHQEAINEIKEAVQKDFNSHEESRQLVEKAYEASKADPVGLTNGVWVVCRNGIRKGEVTKTVVTYEVKIDDKTVTVDDAMLAWSAEEAAMKFIGHATREV